MNAALERVRRVLKEEKKEGNSAAAIRNCQVGIAYCTDLQQTPCTTNTSGSRAGSSRRCTGAPAGGRAAQGRRQLQWRSGRDDEGAVPPPLPLFQCVCPNPHPLQGSLGPGVHVAQSLVVCVCVWGVYRRWRVVPAGCFRISPPISLLSSSQPTLSSKFVRRNLSFSLVSRCVYV